MKTCPKCGYTRSEKDQQFVPDTECPKCGIVYSKFAEYQKKKTSSPLDYGKDVPTTVHHCKCPDFTCDGGESCDALLSIDQKKGSSPYFRIERAKERSAHSDNTFLVPFNILYMIKRDFQLNKLTVKYWKYKDIESVHIMALSDATYMYIQSNIAAFNIQCLYSESDTVPLHRITDIRRDVPYQEATYKCTDTNATEITHTSQTIMCLIAVVAVTLLFIADALIPFGKFSSERTASKYRTEKDPYISSMEKLEKRNKLNHIEMKARKMVDDAYRNGEIDSTTARQSREMIDREIIKKRKEIGY